eukprot:TRINITY_DN1960_c0_g1_i7.p1 TRINITY_DN1960_c0_g1~~TRINITY_DN1960_c0_g1_i7.p1  ORF type:complete len:2023 (-),score=364.09 TRINITY_DN1960_c0_g1_i7:465-6533(-)
MAKSVLTGIAILVVVIVVAFQVRSTTAATITWQSPSSGTWETGSWNGGTPAPDSDVIINGAVVVTANNPVFVKSVTLNSGAWVIFQNLAQMTNFTINLGTADFRSVAIISIFSLSGASSAIKIGPGSAVNISTTFTWSGAVSETTMLGSSTATGGKLNLLSTCTTNISGYSNMQIQYVTVQNFGYLGFSPANGWTLSNGGIVVNNIGAVFNATKTVAGNLYISGGTFTNFGAVSIALTSVFTVSAAFSNSGSVSVMNGGLMLSSTATVTHTGTFNHQNGTRIIFAGGSHTLAANSTVTSGNGIEFAGATTYIYGTFQPTTFTQTSGLTSFCIPFSTSQPLIISGGSLEFKEQTTLSSLTLAGTSSYLRATGPNGVVNITDTFVWNGTDARIDSGSTVGGVINLLQNCQSQVIGAGTMDIRYTQLVNMGYLEYRPTGDGIRVLTNTLINAVTGIFNVTTTDTRSIHMKADPDTLKFPNYGLFNVKLNAGYYFFAYASLENKGTLNVESGCINFASTLGAANHTGNFTHAASNAIRFTAGTHTLGASSVVSDGPGIVFGGSTVNIYGTFAPANFTQSAGVVNFYVPFVTTSPLTLAAGTLHFLASSKLASFSLLGGALMCSGQFVTCNITDSFIWGGVSAALASNTSGGTINLMSTCDSTFSGDGAAQNLSYVSLYNYGHIQYRATSNGVRLNTLGKFINVGTMQVNGTTPFMFYTSGSGSGFENRGVLSVNIDQSAAFSIYAIFTNFGEVIIDRGILELRQGPSAVTHMGSFKIGTVGQAFLKFLKGNHTLGPTSSVGEESGIEIYGDSVTVNTTNFLADVFSVKGGLTTFLVPYQTEQVINITGGRLDFKASSILGGVRLTGGNLASSGPSVEVNITTLFSWGGTDVNLDSSSAAVGSRINLMSTCVSEIIGAGINQFVSYVALYNYGTMLYKATGIDGIRFRFGGSLYNVGSMSVNTSIEGDTNISDTTNGITTLQNTGTILVQVNPNYSFQVAATLVNEGTLRTISGITRLRKGAIHTGTFEQTAGASIDFFAGTHNLTSTSTVENGAIIFESGEVTIEGTFAATQLTILGGIVNLNPLNEVLNIPGVNASAGTLNFLNPDKPVLIDSMVKGGSALTFFGDLKMDRLDLTIGVFRVKKNACFNYLSMDGNPSLQIDSTAKVYVYNTFTWSGAASAQVITPAPATVGGSLNLMPNCSASFTGSSSSHVLQYVKLNNFGNVTYAPTNNGIQLQNGATWVNHPGSIMRVAATSGDIKLGASVPTTHYFDNFGTLVVTGGSTRFTVSANFRNYGTISITTARLTISGPATQFSGRTSLFDSATFVTPVITMSGGYLEGKGTVSGLVSHTGGTLRPGGLNTVGTFYITNYSGSSTAIIEIEASNSSVFDKLTVSATASLPPMIIFTPIGDLPTALPFTLQSVITAPEIDQNTPRYVSANYNVSGKVFLGAADYLNITIVSEAVPQCPACNFNNSDCVGGYCICRDGFSGLTCGQFVCPAGCGSGGTCSGPNTCTCLAGYSGGACSVALGCNFTVSPITTGVLTTGLLTTSALSTGPLTTSVSTGLLTTTALTTGTLAAEVSTGDITTGTFTTDVITSGTLTTGAVTSGIITTETTAETTEITTGNFTTEASSGIFTVETTSESTSTQPLPMTSSEPASSSSSDSSNSRIIGGAVAGVVVLLGAFAALLAFILVRRKRKQKQHRRDDEVPLSVVTRKSNDIPILQNVKVGQRLGSGNFGEVFHGVWNNGSQVALKKLKSAEDEEAFEKELGILFHIGAHPSIVQFLGKFTSPAGERFIVMEYLPKGSLVDFFRLEKRNLTLKDLMDMIISLLNGMLFLEMKNILHRDLSCRNLLVTKSDEKYSVKITDFGMSRNENYLNNYSPSSNKALPVRWCAPEVIQSLHFSNKSEVWGAGVTMWEILSYGSAPFSWLSNQEVAEQVVSSGLTLSRPKDCPEELWAIITPCFRYEPDERPSFKDIAEQVRDFVVTWSQRNFVTSRQNNTGQVTGGEEITYFEPQFENDKREMR